MNALMVIGMIALVVSTPAKAVEDYDACLDLIGSDADRAEREAGEWARFGGGAPARHCYALALLAIGAQSRGIDELLGMAIEEPGLEPEARADILIQAGEPLMEEPDLRLDQWNVDALALRARVRLANGDSRSALRDLDAALQRQPGNARFLTLRAAANRRLDRHVEARDDASFATERDPGDASAWLERGRAEAALRDTNAARFSFLESIALDRDGSTGASAQRALQRMEAGIAD